MAVGRAFTVEIVPIGVDGGVEWAGGMKRGISVRAGLLGWYWQAVKTIDTKSNRTKDPVRRKVNMVILQVPRG